MKNVICFILVIFPFYLTSYGIQCPYGCGEPYYDPDVTYIGQNFKNCLKELNFLKKQHVPRCPELHSSFLTSSGEKHYLCWGYVSWEVEEDNYGEYDAYTFYHDRYEYGDDKDKILMQDFYFSSFNEYLRTFNSLHQDILFIYEAELSYYQQRIRDVKLEINFLKNRKHIDFGDPFIGISNEVLKQSFIDEIKTNTQKIENIKNRYRNELSISYQYQGIIEKVYIDIFEWCIKYHDWVGAYYQRGLLNFNNGNILDSLSDIRHLIEKSEDLEADTSEVLFLKGQTEVELGLYHDAIISLSETIQKDSRNKEAYFERAQAYFELGKFDLAINDYLKSSLKVSPIYQNDFSTINFSKGLIKGTIKGGVDATVDFVPSALATLRGLSNGLWSFVIEPIECSKELVDACENCISFIKDNTGADILETMVPEFRELIKEWSLITDERKGELFGYVIGKYGIDILMTAGSLKAVKYYRDLKTANAMLTFEKCAKSTKNAEIILKESLKKNIQREAFLKNANLKIQWDKQVKHIIGHKNYIEGRSILCHKQSQSLI